MIVIVQVYSLIDINKEDIASDFTNKGSGTPSVNNHLLALVDASNKRFIYLGVSSSSTSGFYFKPDTLCSDGKYLYASMYRNINREDYGIDDSFGGKFSRAMVHYVVYKIDKDLNVLDRITSKADSLDNEFGLISCSALVCNPHLYRFPPFYFTYFFFFLCHRATKMELS